MVGIQNRVADLVAHLVGMAFRDGFGGEEEVLGRHVVGS